MYSKMVAEYQILQTAKEPSDVLNLSWLQNQGLKPLSLVLSPRRRELRVKSTIPISPGILDSLEPGLLS